MLSSYSQISVQKPSPKKKERVCPSLLHSLHTFIRKSFFCRVKKKKKKRNTTTSNKRREAFHFCFSVVVFGGVSLESIYNINGEKFEPIWSVVRIQNHVVIIIFLLRGTSGGGKFESATDQQRSDENNNENNTNRFRGGGKDDGDDGNRSNDHQNTPLRSIIQRRAKALTEATAGGFYLHRIYRGPNRE